MERGRDRDSLCTELVIRLLSQAGEDLVVVVGHVVERDERLDDGLERAP